MFRLPGRTSGAAPSPLLVALSFGGVAFTLVQLVVGSQMGIFPIPGRDEYIWDRVGDALWSGAPMYYRAPALQDSFAYAPPLAVLFGLVSWAPIVLQHALWTVLKIVSLRLIAGSWLGAGVACWFPLVAFDLGGGNFNLIIAAAIVLAIQARPQLAILTSFAKFAPALAIDPRAWRPAATSFVVMVLVTLPWWYRWPEWIGFMLGNAGNLGELGSLIPIPWTFRLIGAAALLVLVRTRSARALAATIAIPAFYWGSLVILIAPVAILVRERLARRASAQGAAASASPNLGVAPL